MSTTVSVHLTPELIDPARLNGATAVIIDALRASTTIVHALANQARAVIPVLEVADALRRAKEFQRESVLLGGERGGELIPGFDLDNSPFSYTADVVSGKTIIFTTTNGTKALLKSSSSHVILIGALVNLTAVARAASETGLPIHLVCAGTEGDVSAEDVLTAGAILAELQKLSGSQLLLNDSALLAQELFRNHGESSAALLNMFSISRGGKNLQTLGYHRDIERSATVDLFSMVPVYDADTGELKPLG